MFTLNFFIKRTMQVILLSVFSSILSTISLSVIANTSNRIKQSQVVIIGAGVAGLTAANRLYKEGVRDIVVLEARSRIGGRVWSFHPIKQLWRGRVLDLGASYIHQSRGNPLKKIAVKAKIKTQVVDGDDYDLYHENGDSVTDDYEEKSYSLFQDFEAYLTRQQEEESDDSKRSVYDALRDFVKYKKVSKLYQPGLLFMVSSHLEYAHGADSKNLSLIWFDNDKGFDGPDHFFPEGYSQLVNYIASPIKAKIKLNTVVTKIDYSNPTDIAVYSSSGEIYRGRYVICTLPIGVLRANRVHFIPQLPLNKLIAIHRHIGFSRYEKAYLLFPRVFWDSAFSIERILNSKLRNGFWKNKMGWIDFTNFASVKKLPVIQATFAGDFVSAVHAKTKKEKVHSIMKALESIYGKRIPKPLDVIFTDWSDDQFSRGSFSYLRPGALAENMDFSNMAQPVRGHLLFAGEGTSRYYFGTVHGAYLSGIRVARYILNKHYKNHSGE